MVPSSVCRYMSQLRRKAHTEEIQSPDEKYFAPADGVSVDGFPSMTNDSTLLSYPINLSEKISLPSCLLPS